METRLLHTCIIREEDSLFDKFLHTAGLETKNLGEEIVMTNPSIFIAIRTAADYYLSYNTGEPKKP